MFDLFFAGATAFNQAMLLLAALLFIGIGAFLLGHEIHWRLRALRVTGTVIGVRVKKPSTYHTVYRYSLPSGQTAEATSTVGTSSVKGRDTGRAIELRVFADRPEEVSEAAGMLAGIFGVLFIAIGLWPLHVALTAWPVTPFTWVMLLAVLAYVAFRFRAHMIPKAERKPLAQWREDLRAKHKTELAAIPVRRIEDILSAPETIERRRKERRTYRFVVPVLLVAGIAALVLAVHLGQKMSERLAEGQRTEGRVVSLAETSDADGSMYYPVVRFDAHGTTLEFRDSIGANPPSYRPGERVTVLYREQAAQESAIIDRGLWNWLPTGLLGLLGCFLLFAATRFLASLRDDPPTMMEAAPRGS